MKYLRAPWRRNYIEQGGVKGCIFCEKPAAGDDRAQHIVRRGKWCFLMLNRYPYTGGHCMVAPYRHIPDLAALSSDERDEMMVMVRDTVELLKKKLAPHGFNVGMNLGRVAGAGVVGHIHVHVVPRWNGDTNFMPVTAGTKVLSHSLDDMYALLSEPQR